MPKNAMPTIRKVVISSDEGTSRPNGRPTRVAPSTTTIPARQSAARRPARRVSAFKPGSGRAASLHQLGVVLEHRALLGRGLRLPLVLHLRADLLELPDQRGRSVGDLDALALDLRELLVRQRLHALE